MTFFLNIWFQINQYLFFLPNCQKQKKVKHKFSVELDLKLKIQKKKTLCYYICCLKFFYFCSKKFSFLECALGCIGCSSKIKILKFCLVNFFDIGKSYKQTAQRKISFLALSLLEQITFENFALYQYFSKNLFSSVFFEIII